VAFDVTSVLGIEVYAMGVEGKSREAEKKGAIGSEGVGEVWLPRRLQILHGGHLPGLDCLQFGSGALLEKDQVTLLLHDGVAPIVAVSQLLLEISL